MFKCLRPGVDSEQPYELPRSYAARGCLATKQTSRDDRLRGHNTDCAEEAARALTSRGCSLFQYAANALDTEYFQFFNLYTLCQ